MRLCAYRSLRLMRKLERRKWRRCFRTKYAPAVPLTVVPSSRECHAVSRNELLLPLHLSQVLSFLSLEMIFTLLIGGLAVLVFWVSFVYRPRGTSRGPRRRRIP